MLDSENAVYEFDKIWDVEFMGSDAVKRVAETARHVPTNVSSVLDVGCGNGLFLHLLQQEKTNRFTRLVGADRSLAALKRVSAEKVECSVNKLPFADGEFDLVSCQEVLEHLPNAIFGEAISEIARVSSSHILVTVPYRENLAADRKSVV